ncbi:MAG TPA: AraC family transcriptional regulator ligand-binding domain-containing protein [Terriglobales bacterium]|jgi:AraC-like DNA-binding protein|nr:AraC family transcriptional regulator ligand-binding domain-containing protein [Terriglobales bacterium]
MTADAKKLINSANLQGPAGDVFPSQPVATLRVFLTALGRLGYDLQALRNAAGVTEDQLENPEGRVPCNIPAVICEAMRRDPSKHLGVKVAAQTPIGAFRLLDYLIVTCETVGEGMHQLARYLRLSEAPFSVEIRDEEDPIRIVYLGIKDSFLAEFEVALTIFHLRGETESSFHAEYVSFTHDPGDVAEIEPSLGCPVRTKAAWLGLVVSPATWQLPLRRRDPVLHSVLRRNADELASRLADEDAVVHDLRRMLTNRLRQGDSDIATVARSMASSVRSLQRRLAAAGTSYQEVLDGTRREAADQYLSDVALSTSEVAYLLGYSEPAAFHRAFKRWHGSTPHEYRLRRVPQR